MSVPTKNLPVLTSNAINHLDDIIRGSAITVIINKLFITRNVIIVVIVIIIIRDSTVASINDITCEN